MIHQTNRTGHLPSGSKLLSKRAGSTASSPPESRGDCWDLCACARCAISEMTAWPSAPPNPFEEVLGNSARSSVGVSEGRQSEALRAQQSHWYCEYVLLTSLVHSNYYISHRPSAIDAMLLDISHPQTQPKSSTSSRRLGQWVSAQTKRYLASLDKAVNTQPMTDRGEHKH